MTETVTTEELNRLREIEKIVVHALYNSSGFHSAWEFDSHTPGVDGEESWEKLAVLVERGGHIIYCQRCCAKMHPDGMHEVNGKKICSTCKGETRFVV